MFQTDKNRIIRIGVTGGRDYTNTAKATHVLDRAYSVFKDRMYLVVGDARGLDFICRNWADATLKPEQWSCFYANWDLYGKKAGILRNEEMAKSGLDLLISFPGGKGTKHMTEYCRELNIKILEIK